MIAQTLNVVFYLAGYIAQESRIMRIGGTSKHKVLPYQNAAPVGFLKERIVFIDTAAPHTNHIHIG